MKGASSIALLSLIGTLSTAVYGSVLPRDAKAKPVIAGNFADPSIIKVGNTWYAFASNDRGDAKDHKAPNVQISTSTDFKKWSKPDGKEDALPDPGCWTQKGPLGGRDADVWAPHVVEIPNPHKLPGSQFVMYYSARQQENSNSHCISAAVATDIKGPYLARSQPIACHNSQGGAVDPAGFQDSDGKLYVVYKVDGNSKGHGGACGNTVKPIQATPIMLQGLRDDGVTPVGEAKQILDRSDADGPLVEAPNIVKRDNMYYLFFSSQCTTDPNYDTSYATSKELCGPYKKTDKPLLVAGGDLGLVGPGSSTVTPDGENIVFHAWVDKTRSMFTGLLTFKGETVSVKVQS
ncbi:MAG: hypothetical protein M1830_006576 [Pleopsidium flavum]|nr:MAG: hypothetical protein M1830_006576 [Pleopsidium flavum]